MKKSLLSAIPIISVLIAAFVPGPGHAEVAKKTKQGVYVTIGAGGSWTSDADIERYADYGALVSDTSGTIDLGGGMAAEGGIGYDFGNNIRAELTYTYNAIRMGTIDANGELTVFGVTSPYSARFYTDGTVSRHSVLASAYYDISNKSKFTPYVGAGIGYVNLSIPTIVTEFDSQTPEQQFRDKATIKGGSAGSFGYQAKVGVSYGATEATDLFVEGTYAGNASVDIADSSIGSLDSFGARAGVRIRFGG